MNLQPSTCLLAGTFTATTDYGVLAHCDAAIICVPTPLNKTRDPDVRYHHLAAGESLAQHIHRGMLVVLESTTYPGTTEELLRADAREQSASASSVRGRTDFFLAFSPERIDPGDPIYMVENTPKVVGGVTAACRDVAVALYGADHPADRAGLLDAGGRDGQAARKHLPRREHRAGQRDGDHVRQAGRSTSGR